MAHLYSSTRRFTETYTMFSGAPSFGGGGGHGNSGAQAVLSTHVLINADGLGTRLWYKRIYEVIYNEIDCQVLLIVQGHILKAGTDSPADKILGG